MTFSELFDRTAPSVKWILENLPNEAPGPLEALLALEVCKRTLLVASAKLPDFDAQWERLLKELDESMECFVIEAVKSIDPNVN